MIRCSICLESEESIGALRCGHIFCLDCIGHQFRVYTHCPKCRQPSSADHVLRLYPDGDAPKDASSVHSKTMADMIPNIPKIEDINRRVAGLTADSTEDDLRGLVIAGERVMLDFSNNLEPVFRDILTQMNDNLGALRRRLKYSARLSAAKTELGHHMTLVNTRQAEVTGLIQDRELAYTATADAEKRVRELHQVQQDWASKYARLKLKYGAQEDKVSSLHKQHSQRLQALRNSLQTMDLKMIKYKKQAIAARQAKAKATRAPASSREYTPCDEDLEITDLPIPGAFPSGPKPMIPAYPYESPKLVMVEDAEFTDDDASGSEEELCGPTNNAGGVHYHVELPPPQEIPGPPRTPKKAGPSRVEKERMLAIQEGLYGGRELPEWKSGNTREYGRGRMY